MDPRTGTNLTDFHPYADLKDPYPKEHLTCLAAAVGPEAISITDQKRLVIWKFNPVHLI